MVAVIDIICVFIVVVGWAEDFQQTTIEPAMVGNPVAVAVGTLLNIWGPEPVKVGQEVVVDPPLPNTVPQALEDACP